MFLDGKKPNGRSKVKDIRFSQTPSKSSTRKLSSRPMKTINQSECISSTDYLDTSNRNANQYKISSKNKPRSIRNFGKDRSNSKEKWFQAPHFNGNCTDTIGEFKVQNFNNYNKHDYDKYNYDKDQLNAGSTEVPEVSTWTTLEKLTPKFAKALSAANAEKVQGRFEQENLSFNDIRLQNTLMHDNIDRLLYPAPFINTQNGANNRGVNGFMSYYVPCFLRNKENQVFPVFLQYNQFLGAQNQNNNVQSPVQCLNNQGLSQQAQMRNSQPVIENSQNFNPHFDHLPNQTPYSVFPNHSRKLADIPEEVNSLIGKSMMNASYNNGLYSNSIPGIERTSYLQNISKDMNHCSNWNLSAPVFVPQNKPPTFQTEFDRAVKPPRPILKGTSSDFEIN